MTKKKGAGLKSTSSLFHNLTFGGKFRCGEGNLVPEGGCMADNSLDILSQKCNNLDSCVVEATSEVFGDPCPDTYKYLNVIYSCESKGIFSKTFLTSTCGCGQRDVTERQILCRKSSNSVCSTTVCLSAGDPALISCFLNSTCCRKGTNNVQWFVTALSVLCRHQGRSKDLL